MKLTVTTADQTTEHYDDIDIEPTFDQAGVLKLQTADGTVHYLSPAFWQSAVLEGPSSYDVTKSGY